MFLITHHHHHHLPPHTLTYRDQARGLQKAASNNDSQLIHLVNISCAHAMYQVPF